MIKLKLVFGKGIAAQDVEIVNDELLKDAVTRACANVPLGQHKPEDVFNVVVNGLLIDKCFWEVTKLKSQDTVVISPRIGDGDSGQIFKQALLITIAIVVSIYIPPLAPGAWGAVAAAAITIGATLLLNALIPPPVPELGGEGYAGRSIDNSQMYSITGQSNQMRRLGIVPKVYGVHRMYPMVACTPYTELAVDPDTGEVVQYLYAIYDFGLGSMRISDLKIGDTPLTTDSFRDFEYRLIDPNRPNVDEDEFDAPLQSTFQNYNSPRITTPLSLVLNDGDESIQFSDANIDGLDQSIGLDFVCPRGLYGFSSTGAVGNRTVKMEIHFALVGTDVWHAYNDLDFVDTYSSVGGTDVTDFFTLLAVTGQTANDYYSKYELRNVGSYNAETNAQRHMTIQYRQRKMILPDGGDYQIGAKVFYGTRMLGIITEVNAVVGPNTEIVLDRDLPNGLEAFWYGAYANIQGGPIDHFTAGPFDVKSIKIVRHEIAAAVITAAKTSAVYGNFRFKPKVPGQYKIRVRRINSFGTYSTQKADDVTWIGLTTQYETVPINTDKRHVFLELKIKATNQLNGNIANLSGIVSSVLPVYDPDTQTWTRAETNNPAWVFCDLLTGQVNKRAISVSRLHMDSIVEWADFCDEIPASPPGAEFLEPRFMCNFILDYETNLQGVLNSVTSAGQASLNLIDGKHGVLIDRLKTVPVQLFTPRNSRDFSSSRIYGPRPDGVKVKYIDPQLNWEVSERIVYDNGFTRLNAVNFDELTSFACTNHEQAWRFGRYMIAQNKLRQETINILVDFENLVCTRGDYVQFTQDIMRTGGTPARVKGAVGNVIEINDSLDINPDINYGYVYRPSDGVTPITTSTLTPLTASTFEVDGAVPGIGDLIVIGEVGSLTLDCIVKSISPNDDMSANVQLVEKADAIFDYESSDTLPDYDPQVSDTSRTDFYPPKAVTDLEITDSTWECSATRSGYTIFVELLWNIPAGSVYEFFEIWVDDGRGYSLAAQTNNKLFRYEVDQARLGIEHGFKVVAVSASGKKLQLIAMPEVFSTPLAKTTPPSDVENFSMNITNHVLQLTWDPIPDCDIFQYLIRFSPDSNDVWESTTPLQTVSKNVSSVSVQARTGVYQIKAVDAAGNQSVNAGVAITTIPNLFDLNIIETVNDAPAFDGVLEQTVLLGEAVILDEAVSGDVNTMQYYSSGFYTYADILDLDDVFTVRLQSQIRAEGLKFGELMSDWAHLADIDHLNSTTSDDWDVNVEYRATDIFAAMADWVHLSEIDHINYGAGVGFTAWRPIPTVGDATGRIFQFRVELISNTPLVTPRLFDGTISADMPDRVDSFENLISSASEAYAVTYEHVFKGPGTSPNVQVSIDNAQTGDYWTFGEKTLAGLSIRFYDKNNVQVSRQFDLVAQGYGRRHTTTI